MNDTSVKNIEVTIVGRGSKLIGGTIKTQLPRKEVVEFLQSGFFPLVDSKNRSTDESTIGLKQAGLPYATDARITAQLAKFLALKSQNSSRETTFTIPSAVLFNGGTMKGDLLRKNLVDQLNQWAKEFDQSPVIELPVTDYDFAVSTGAVYYGLARQGQGVRVKAGVSRSYFIGVEDAAPAVPGRRPKLRALCVVPYGMEEGSEKTVENQEFALILGEKAAFRFFSYNAPKFPGGESPQVGMIAKENVQREMQELHSLEVTLDRNEQEGKMVQVKLMSRVTELGVLELWCESPEGRRWKLEYDVRD